MSEWHGTPEEARDRVRELFINNAAFGGRLDARDRAALKHVFRQLLDAEKKAAERHEVVRSLSARCGAIMEERDTLKAALVCGQSSYGTHRCVRCDSEVEP